MALQSPQDEEACKGGLHTGNCTPPPRKRPVKRMKSRLISENTPLLAINGHDGGEFFNLQK